jgi:RNA-directed DNA polymerase
VDLERVHWQLEQQQQEQQQPRALRPEQDAGTESGLHPCFFRNTVMPTPLGFSDNGWPFFGPVTLEEVFEGYYSCRKNKRQSLEVRAFERDLMRRLVDLHASIQDRTYVPEPSTVFAVLHPKPREVWAAALRDRVIHHVIYNRLSPRWHALFSTRSYACIPGRGVLQGVYQAEKNALRVTDQWRREGWWIKADVQSFFNSLHKPTLWSLLWPSLQDEDTRFLVSQTLFSHATVPPVITSSPERMARIPEHKSLLKAPSDRGLPIGNLTSQFFANVYLDGLDRFLLRARKVKHYTRYMDDFIIMGEDREALMAHVVAANTYLETERSLVLNPLKTQTGRLCQGVDFVGFFLLPGRRYRRRSTAARAMAQLKDPSISNESRASLEGLFAQAQNRWRK